MARFPAVAAAIFICDTAGKTASRCGHPKSAEKNASALRCAILVHSDLKAFSVL